jgi:sortase A
VGRVRLVVRTLSELCITVGAIIVLFVAYLLLWTGVRADHDMDSEIGRLERQWSATPVAGPTTPSPGSSSSSSPSSAPASPRAAPSPRPVPYRDGSAFAVMYIPRFGSGWRRPVLEGTSIGTLRKGLGHYTGTAALGAVGNFAVAGHRRTYGDPFKDFPELRPGDEVVIVDGTLRYTYVIDHGPFRTVPTDVGVIDPVPRESGYTRPGRYLTLTTCDPEWGHSHRLIAWGHLERTTST